MWAFIQDGEIKATYSKLPKNNGEGGVNLHSIKLIGKLFDNDGVVIIEKHDFGIDYDKLKELGYYKVVEENAPEYDNSTHQAPVLKYAFVDDEVVQVWTVNPKTKEQLSAELEAAWQSIRATRDQLLKQSDWTQLADVPANPDWVIYRQTLRDITDMFDTPDAVIFPDKPS